MNVQYLDFCVSAEGSNFAIWSSKWTPLSFRGPGVVQRVCHSRVLFP